MKKIDRAIKLLTHYNLTPIEIAYQLNYNSLEEFTLRFKSVTGLTPESYKRRKFKTTSEYQQNFRQNLCSI
jgi:AraC-like DNA-binding protein